MCLLEKLQFVLYSLFYWLVWTEENVLVSVWIVVIFFIVAGVRLCFRFVTKTILLTQRSFHYCWEALAWWQVLFCLSPHPIPSGLGMHKELWGNRARTADPKWPQGYPILCGVTLCCVRRRRGGDVQSDGICLLKSPLCLMDPCFPWRWLNICLPVGNGELIPCSALLACLFFLY